MSELYCHSYYSLLDGASSPKALARRAREIGLTSLALTDRNGLYGAPAFYHACKEEGIQPIIGAEVTIEGDEIVLLCKDMEGYGNLSQLITEIHRGDATLEPHREGLICLLSSAENLPRYLELFGREDLAILLTNCGEQGDMRRCAELSRVAEQHGLERVPSHGVRYATREEGQVHDILRCIAHRTPLSRSHHIRPANHNRYLQPLPHHPIADRCQLELDFSAYRFPKFSDSEPEDLRRLCEAKVTSSEMRERLEEELALIERLDLCGYFLIVWDIVEYARRKWIPAQGRGSAANSLVAYLLGITPVNPLEHKLFLGRFLHDEMTTVPDIDIDFAATRSDLPDREDVIQYVYNKYEHAAMVCTFITFKRRSAVRELAMAFELPPEEVPEEYVERLQQIPRHLSIHVGGMVIASHPISRIVPLQPARMPGRVVCQWDKDQVEDAGLIKVDILSLGMLSVLRDVSHLSGVPLDAIPNDDPQVYKMIGSGDTVGVFQVESRAQMQSLPRTRPTNLPELGIQVAIIRPGPLQGNMVSPYIRRRQGLEPVSYPHPCLSAVLEETLGVILFQEQVLQVAVAMAGFTPSQAEGLRKAMGRKRSREAMHQLLDDFIVGAAERGVSRADAEKTFSLLEGFALYGFCKSHALSFATIAYRSAWLKRYHPAAFTVALLNNQPMGFYSPEVLIEDAKRRGVQILPVDIDKSGLKATLEDGAIRLGLLNVTGVGEWAATQIILNRDVQLDEATTEALIRAGAYDSRGERRSSLWNLWEKKLPIGTRLTPQLPPQSDWEKVLDEYGVMQLTAGAHPMAYLRQSLTGYATSTTLKPGHVKVAGLMVCRQRPPTAKGFAFLTLEDESGLMNIIIPPDLYEQEQLTIKRGGLLAICGRCLSQDGVTNVRAECVQSVSIYSS
jgi:error-prone DNA polymerase